MKNNINLITKAIYNDNITKKQAEKEKLYNAKLLLWLELYLKQEFKSYFDKYDLNNAELNIIKNKIDIKVKVYDKILKYYETIEKIKLNDKQETETTEEYVYFFEDLDFLSFTLIFTNNFYSILDNFKKDYKKINELEKKNEKEKKEETKKELANELYLVFNDTFKKYKKKKNGYFIAFEILKQEEQKEKVYKQAINYWDIDKIEFLKIYNNILSIVKSGYNTTIPKKNKYSSLFTYIMLASWVKSWKKPK